ncbi:MAG: hypothetical protein JXA50_09065 [Deltaproteobacteria bacterium]|nr:hypothetical protein [Deltaproteobacteria bacterium]
MERAETSPQPLRFTWNGEVHDVVEVLGERVDTGYGGLPPRSRKWYTRRHRRYFVVRDSHGDVFEIYLDYSNRSRQSWWLVTRSDQKRSALFTERSSGKQ